MNKIEKDFFIKFGNIAQLEPSGIWSYTKNGDTETYSFPENYKYKDVYVLMEKSVKENKDFIYELIKGKHSAPYREGIYY